MADQLDQLVTMTRTLGEPARGYVIIGEGNTSVKTDDGGLWVKASGFQMATIDATGFVEIDAAPILAMLDNPPSDLAEEMQIRKAARRDANAPTPSQEVSFHAMLLHECGVSFIGHTHPLPVLSAMCSPYAEAFAYRRLFPDQVVLCGAESVFVPYHDPGLPLAMALRDKVRDYMDRNGGAPRTILLKNHGLIVLGQSSAEVLNITAMCVKAAHVLMTVCATGEPVFMPHSEVLRIEGRPDERYRRNLFAR